MNVVTNEDIPRSFEKIGDQMKHLFFLILSSSLFIAKKSLACPPAPIVDSQFAQQSEVIEKISRSASIKESMEALANGQRLSITSINLEAQPFLVLSNSCVLRLKRDRTNTGPGACDNLLPLIVDQVNCIDPNLIGR